MRIRKRKLGLAFSDELNKVSRKAGHFSGKKLKEVDWEESLLSDFDPNDGEEKVSPWRLVLLGSLFIILFFGLFLRIFHLQVVRGEENREMADLNRIQVKVNHAPRGVIYDRNGKVLAENNPGFRLKDQFLTRDEVLLIEAKGDPQFNDLELDTVRSYPLGPVTSHILGYVGQVTAEELDTSQSGVKKSSPLPEKSPLTYKLGDRIGRAGIEKSYESYLRGIDGAEIIEIDAQGKPLRVLRRIDPIPGKNVYLSIDADLQKVSYESLKQGVEKVGSCCGAVVAENPQTGEILALASIPSYDGNAFTDPKRNSEVAGYFNDARAPMLNRAIAGVYPPGSTFKIVSALAGLYSGKINTKTQFEDTGIMNLGPYTFANWYFTSYGRKEGLVDTVKALQRSNDIFFYHVGDLVGEKVMGEVAEKLGYGKKVGIDIPGEVSGLIPTRAWKEKNIGEVWYPGDNLHMAIGQGFLLATPLQVLVSTAFMAEKGSLTTPHLVTKITSPQGAVIKEFRFDPIVKDVFKKEYIDLINKGLSEVPKDGGTAWPFFAFSIPTAGKTGTAEFGDPKGKTHAWYTAYAPEDNPQIAATALVEAGGEGSSVTAPIIKDIYTWYFNPDKTQLRSLDKGVIATESARILGE